MRLKNNEDGSTLLMVILLVAVIAILGTALFAMNASATKQFSNKEEQVQARHLAEMGVEHYQAKVSENLKRYNREFIPIKKKGIVDEGESQKKYVKGLCEEVLPYSINNNDAKTGDYKVEVTSKKPHVCDVSNDNVTVSIISTGTAKETPIVIEAEITVTDPGTSGGNIVNIGNAVGFLLDKSKYPTSNTLTKVKTFDDIGSLEAVKVANSTSKNNRFETSAFVEVDSFNIQKSSWTFTNHLLIKGNASFLDNGTTLTVGEDLYIDGDFTSSNHSEINVGKNLIINGKTEFTNHLKMIVSGSALFVSGNFKIYPNARVEINQHAYFKSTVDAPGKSRDDTICVKGDILLWKTNSWQPYTQQDDGYNVFDKECLGTGQPTSPPDSSGRYNWKVKEAVKAIYN